MGRDWSKSKSRTKAVESRRAEIDVARILAEDLPRQSKDELRAQAAEALSRYHGPIRRLPTLIDLKCYHCNHRGRVVLRDTSARFVCSKCGAKSL